MPEYVCPECGAGDDLEWFCTECGDTVPNGRCMTTRECQDAATVEHCCGCGEKAVGRD